MLGYSYIQREYGLELVNGIKESCLKNCVILASHLTRISAILGSGTRSYVALSVCLKADRLVCSQILRLLLQKTERLSVVESCPVVQLKVVHENGTLSARNYITTAAANIVDSLLVSTLCNRSHFLYGRSNLIIPFARVSPSPP